MTQWVESVRLGLAIVRFESNCRPNSDCSSAKTQNRIDRTANQLLRASGFSGPAPLADHMIPGDNRVGESNG